MSSIRLHYFHIVPLKFPSYFPIPTYFCLILSMSHLIFSHASKMELRMAMLVRQSTILVQTQSISTMLWWIAMEFCTDIHNLQRMTTNYFGDSLTLTLAPPCSWHCLKWLSADMLPTGWILLTKDDEHSRYYSYEHQQVLVLYGGITSAEASLQWLHILNACVDSKVLFATCEALHNMASQYIMSCSLAHSLQDAVIVPAFKSNSSGSGSSFMGPAASRTSHQLLCGQHTVSGW